MQVSEVVPSLDVLLLKFGKLCFNQVLLMSASSSLLL